MSEAATSSGIHWDALPDMLTPADLAAIMRANRRTVIDWSKWGKLPQPTIRSGKKLLWQKQKIRDWLDRTDRMRP